MDEHDESYDLNQKEAWHVYEMSKDAGVRPYIYYFPYLECPHSMNAIDIVIRRIWIRIEVERKQERESKQVSNQNPSNPQPPTNPDLEQIIERV